MIPVHELKAPAVGLAWHEVAALVLDAATALGDRPASDLADLTAIQLAEDGYLVLPHGREHESPVRQLAQLLEHLLDGLGAPDEMRAVASRHLTTPPTDGSFEAFLSELSRFERPDRTAILSQLAARAASVDRDVDGSQALAQLASRVRNDEKADSGTATPSASRGRHRSAFTVFAVVLGIAAVVFLALAYYVAPAHPDGVTPQPVVARVQAGAAELVASVSRALQPGPAPEPAPQPTAAPAPPRTGRRVRPRPVAGHPPAPDRVVSLQSMDPSAVPNESAPPAAISPASADQAVYTSADPDVTPASLLQTHLPSQPPSTVAPEDVGTLELLVTETGRVAHVKLISAPSRFQERMLVAAAKTWRFQPALKDGRPVRYRARVRITL